MKKFSYFKELLISGVLILMLLLLINPFHFWMPNFLLMLILTILSATFLIFASLFWREKPKDERENFHSMTAGRISYLSGITTLIVGLIYQSIKHEIDIWLPIAITVMLISKIISHIYQSTRN